MEYPIKIECVECDTLYEFFSVAEDIEEDIEIFTELCEIVDRVGNHVKVICGQCYNCTFEAK